MAKSSNDLCIREIVKKKAREKGYSLNGIARILGKTPTYIRSVLIGKEVSRPTVYRIAKLIDFPELCFLYEEMLENQRIEKGKREGER